MSDVKYFVKDTDAQAIDRFVMENQKELGLATKTEAQVLLDERKAKTISRSSFYIK